MTYRYVFDGAGDEDFPEPPIARTLRPGDEIETDIPVDHPRLVPLDTHDLDDAEPSAEADQVQVAQPDLAPLVAPDVTSTPAATEGPPATA